MQATGGPRWTEYQGLTIDGLFPLERYLGGSAHSGVYLTRSQSERAAIKLVPADLDESSRLLAQWQAASQLTHPHLLRIFAGGECYVDGIHFAYVVTECSDEDLSQILPERRLTAGESKDMLQAVSAALEFLHSRGAVHGALKPSNVLAVSEELKLASDSIVLGGDSKEDIWALGELLDQVVETPLRAPFDEIVQHCLDPNTPTRWTAGEIAARLKQGDPSLIATQRREFSKSPSLLTAAIAVILIAGLIAIWRGKSDSSPAAAPPAAPILDSSGPVKPSVASSTPKPAVRPPSPKPVEKGPRAEPVSRTPVANGIEQVMPEIPAKALGTIHGSVRVNVRAKVDAAGKVTDVSLEPTSASKYFTDRILKATRQWKFQPVAATYVIRYQLRSDGPAASASRVE